MNQPTVTISLDDAQFIIAALEPHHHEPECSESLGILRAALKRECNRLERELEEVDALKAAAHNLEVAANSVVYCYDNRPENFAAALDGLKESAIVVREIIAVIKGNV